MPSRMTWPVTSTVAFAGGECLQVRRCGLGGVVHLKIESHRASTSASSARGKRQRGARDTERTALRMQRKSKRHQPQQGRAPEKLAATMPQANANAATKEALCRRNTQARGGARCRRACAPSGEGEDVGKSAYKRSSSSAPIVGAQGHISYCASPNRVYGSLSRILSSVAWASLSGTRNSSAPPLRGTSGPEAISRPSCFSPCSRRGASRCASGLLPAACGNE